MKKKRIIGNLPFVVVILAMISVVIYGCGEEKHNDKIKTPPDAHEAEEKDEHEGHDHSAHEEEEKDEHEGHDHSAHEEEEKDEHEGHDHSAHEEEEKDEHEGHDHSAHEEEEKDEEANHVELTAEQRKHINLTVAVAGSGSIMAQATFMGESILNPDRMVHVVPQAAGIVREVKKNIGDRVKAGDILAWIESDELAEAKLSYYAKQSEVGCCLIELPRTEAIFKNTAKLLILLKKSASQEELHTLDNLEMGRYRGESLTAYVEYQSTQKAYEREKSLRSKKIASEQELLEAHTAYLKAREAFHAIVDVTQYETLIAYTEAIQEKQVAEFEVVAAEKRLRLKGADDAVIAKLMKLVPKTEGLTPCVCDDPDCKEGEIPSITETLGKDKRFAWYPIRATISGIITEKHLTIGEKVTDEESVCLITDFSKIWIRFNIYQKDLYLININQPVKIAIGADKYRQGLVAYIAPIIDRQTRTIQARVELDNSDGTLRPGLYVTVQVTRQSKNAAVVIPKLAVQALDEENIVFIEEGDGFEASRVTLGMADRQRVVITSGLKPGQRYVVQGAFDLKAKIVTSGQDAHAGHGH